MGVRVPPGLPKEIEFFNFDGLDRLIVMKDLIRYLAEVKVELSRILWPSFNELVGSVIIVLLLVSFFSVYIGFIDVLFYKIAGRIF